MKNISFGVVVAALAVSLPRLISVFLLGSGIEIPEQIEIVILTSTGIGSGVVLTVGNALLAHALATKAHERGPLWWINGVAWVLLVAGAVILVAPALVAGVRQSALAAVLTTPVGEWLWAVCAVAVVEVLVGAAVAATILVEENVLVSTRVIPSRWGIVWDALANRVAYAIDPVAIHRVTDAGFVLAEAEDLFPEETLTWFSPGLAEPAVAQEPARSPRFRHPAAGKMMSGGFLMTEPFIAEPVMIESAGDMRRIHAASSSAVPSARIHTPEFGAEPLADVSFRARTKAEALERTVEYFRHHPQASVAEVAENIGRSESTVRSYLVELESENCIERNEDGVHVHLENDERA